jgi:ABC-type branched-subunit amino acid transport system ATPase component/ABC-type branched-subunit amino acid transport system permease subunit
VVPALAAALVGRFDAFGLTVIAAMVIGMVQQVISLFQPNIAKTFGFDPLSLTGLPDVVPMVLILAVTIAGGGARPRRGERAERLPLPGGGRIPLIPLVGAVIASVFLLFGIHGWADAMITTFATGLLVLSIVVVTGFAGQLSLAQFALAGFGAWVAARVSVSLGASFLVALVAAVAGTILIGLLVALPALRTRGVNLAVATLGLSLVINALVFTNGSLTGGFTGLPVKAPSLFGIDLDPIRKPERYGAFALVLVVVCGLLVANLRRGRAGRRLLAVRANERVAASLGVGVYGGKLYAFALASAIAALGGVILGFRTTNVRFDGFNVLGSIAGLQYAVLGGIGWVASSGIGPLLAAGGIINRFLNERLSSVHEVGAWLLVIAGVAVILTLQKSPDGIAASVSRDAARFRDVLTFPRRNSLSVPPAALVASEPRQPAVVEVRDLTVKFGGVVALSRVSFTLRPGEVVGLIGPNGAGKTTVLDVVSGFTKPTAGDVLLGGQSIASWSPERRARAGVTRSWQAVELFHEMNIRDNLLVAADEKKPLMYLTDLIKPGRQPMTALVAEVIEEFGLTDKLDARPSDLSQGEARLVGIARAIATNPRALLLDEPAAGLDAVESDELGIQIRRIATERNIGILVVEHDVPMLMSTCDRIVVLDFGICLAEGTPAEIAQHPRVIEAYLGAPSVAASDTAQAS